MLKFTDFGCIMVVEDSIPDGRHLFKPGIYFCNHPLDEEKLMILPENIPFYLDIIQRLLECQVFRQVEFPDANVALFLRKDVHIKIEITPMVDSR